MITQINLVNVHHHTWLHNFFPLVMRKFKIYSLSDFQICNTILLTMVAMLYITSPWLTYFITGSLYLLTPFTHFSHPNVEF